MFSVDQTLLGTWNGNLDPNPSSGALNNNTFMIEWTDNVMKGSTALVQQQLIF